MRGKRVCHMHGGKTPSGMQSKKWKHGRYAKGVDGDMARAFYASLEDPQLLDQRREISLVDARIEDLLKRVANDESTERWKLLRRQWKILNVARKKGDREKTEAAVKECERLIIDGCADNESWREIGEQIDRRSRVATAEHKRQVDLKTMIPAERVMAMAGGVIDAINRLVVDPTTRRAIATELGKLMASGGGGRHLAGRTAGNTAEPIDVG